jgi:hypothetical protein
MKSKIMPSEAQEYFERLFNERPAEPFSSSEDPESWAEIAEWERKRAEYFAYIFIHEDCEIAGRLVQ